MTHWTSSERRSAFAAAIAVLIFSLVQVYVNELPEQRELQEATPFEQVPPDEFVMEYVGSILLGGFRAIAVDFLWLRMDRLTKEKKWEEMRLVTEAIGRLQPRMVEVYAHNGWNMAYNISNLFDAPKDKVKWIRAGLEYLEQGARKNPKNERAIFWLGYVYWHRVPRAEHTLAPESEQKVLEIIESQDRRCAYDTAIQYMTKAQRLFDAEENNLSAYYVDKYEGLIVDSMYHIGFHGMGDCWSRPGMDQDPRRWEAAQRQLEETIRYCRYVDNRYFPGTTFWNERIQYIQRLREVIALEEAADAVRRESGLEAAFPITWAIASEYKALKSSKNLFRQGALERRLRDNLFRICEAAYARVEAGEPDPLKEQWEQLIHSCTTRHMKSDPYQESWRRWGDGLKQIREALPDEAAAYRLTRAGRRAEAAQHAVKALAVYEKVIDENGLFEIPLFASRAERLREMAGS